MGMRNGQSAFRWIARGGFVGAGAVPAGLTTAALAGTGQPSHWQMGLQNPATDMAESIDWFHNVLVNPLIIGIAAFVLVLMVYVMYTFNEKRNPKPSTTTHNQLLEVAWTVIPVLSCSRSPFPPSSFFTRSTISPSLI